MLIPAMRAIRRSPLALLVTRVLADDEHRSVAADDLALLAHRLDRRSYLHDPFRLEDQRSRLWPPPSGCRYRSRTHARGGRRARRLDTIAASLRRRTGPPAPRSGVAQPDRRARPGQLDDEP